MTLLELAERCEKAAGPDREIDHAIGLVLGWRDEHTILEPVPFYTASIDAAMTLARHKGEAMLVLRALLAALGNDAVEIADIPRIACVAALRARKARGETL